VKVEAIEYGDRKVYTVAAFKKVVANPTSSGDPKAYE